MWSVTPSDAYIIISNGINYVPLTHLTVQLMSPEASWLVYIYVTIPSCGCVCWWLCVGVWLRSLLLCAVVVRSFPQIGPRLVSRLEHRRGGGECGGRRLRLLHVSPAHAWPGSVPRVGQILHARLLY